MCVLFYIARISNPFDNGNPLYGCVDSMTNSVNLNDTRAASLMKEAEVSKKGKQPTCLLLRFSLFSLFLSLSSLSSPRKNASSEAFCVRPLPRSRKGVIQSAQNVLWQYGGTIRPGGEVMKERKKVFCSKMKKGKEKNKSKKQRQKQKA